VRPCLGFGSCLLLISLGCSDWVKEKLVYARPLGVYWNWEGDFKV